MMRTAFLSIIILFITSCDQKLFEKLEADKTGIHFINQINENDSINILDLEYVYNGGGVAISDFNNDGLQDILFTGNLTGNKLYLNKGQMQFEDITEVAQIEALDKWNTGVATVDINNDGLMDVYICASIKNDSKKRANMLFINKGINKNGKPVFEDVAEAYNIADTSHSTTAAFIDYDNDGDLDLYILVNKMSQGDVYPNQYKTRVTDGSSPNTDKLYRNDWDSIAGHPVFTDVSKEAGILLEGYGLGLSICDINKDGWKDIYVTNDFLTNDILWINNGDGTFTNKAGEYFKHTSYSSMGNDVIDINNDGLPDVIAVDMLPANNIRKKMMMPANSYQSYMNNEHYKYEYQYGRNTLQLNQGHRVNSNDSLGSPIFSEIAFFAGIAETDWSWAPLGADFDNDGYRDIIITNGFPKDITDHDFMTYRVNAKSIALKEDMLEQIPIVKLSNYIFHNNNDLSFTNVSSEWGFSEPSFSNGAAYADLDNDGDLDIVINNINDKAFIYKNHSQKKFKNKRHYLQVKFIGNESNINGIGAWAEVYYDNGNQLVYENTPYRGYLSSVQSFAHFGMGSIETIDSVVIKWHNGKKQVLQNVRADQLLTVNIKDANLPYSFSNSQLVTKPYFTDITASVGIHFQHQEIDFPDFNIQKLLPHKLSEYGPALAVGDVDGNGLEDIICGGSFSFSTTILLQQQDGTFTEAKLQPEANTTTKMSEDMGVLLFDADGDDDLDLYVASGSYESAPYTDAYRDKLFINDGNGNFIVDTMALPKNLSSKSCVRAADFDKDGDLDLFIAGRVEPWSYPKPVSSFIYRNDSRNGKIKFTDVTSSIAKPLINIGLTCDAVWTDLDNDGWQDLVLAGEWMGVTFLKNNKGVFENVSNSTGINNQLGWWTSIAPGDFDNDGDIDYIVGNAGQNTFYRVNEKYPARIYAKDFDNNGSYDAIPSLYLKDEKQNKKEYPAQTRDDLAKQMISMRAKFQNYTSFAHATIDKLLTKEDLKDALILKANNLNSVYLKNLGGGKFEMIPLPVQAQLSTLNGMVVDDFDGDGNLDVVMNTNDYGTEVSVGRYDALNGLFLKGDGEGNFVSTSISKSGLFIPENGKALVKSIIAGQRPIIVASQNRGPLKVFEIKQKIKVVPVAKNDVHALIRFKNNSVQKQEFYYGASFLSQSGRFLSLSDNVASVEIIDNTGNKRMLPLGNFN